MALLRKIFPSKNVEKSVNYNMPEIKLPVDERFTINFKKNGGKFIYCDSLDEIYKNFENILAENQWYKTQMYCVNKQLEKKFKSFDINFTNQNNDTTSFLTTCEYLIADNGSILICSHQIQQNKLKELPDNFVVFATTSQIVENIGEGLRGIKNNYPTKIPNHITTLKHFEIKEENDFMSYGSSSKNLYLLLLEDF